MKSAFRIATASMVASMVLAGCAVYEPQTYGDYPYYQSAPVYVEQGYGYYAPPAPLYTPLPQYVGPPRYVGPPVRFRFDFGYRSGGIHHWHGGHRWDGAHRWGGFGWRGRHH